MEIFEVLDFFLIPKILRLYNCCVVACRDCTISWRAATVIIVVSWRAATILMNVFIIVSNASLVFVNIKICHNLVFRNIFLFVMIIIFEI